MRTVDINTAKVHLSRLLDEVVADEDAVMVDEGEPVVRLLPLRPRRQPRQPSLLKDKSGIADDFDEPLPEGIMAAFRGEKP